MMFGIGRTASGELVAFDMPKRENRYHVAQYLNGKFHSIMSGMGKNRGTWDADHSRRSAQRHAADLRREPWRAARGFTYRVETEN